ncbi:MAG: hypothetical protein MJK18_09520, partial [Bdellovibrionales bacterium]|nr:hypothetical protein [Bdellovibrionales bacterium]
AIQRPPTQGVLGLGYQVIENFQVLSNISTLIYDSWSYLIRDKKLKSPYKSSFQRSLDHSLLSNL